MSRQLPLCRRCAALKAAGADMLAALEAVFADLQAVDNDSQLTPAVGRQVRAAIAKAKGQTA